MTRAWRQHLFAESLDRRRDRDALIKKAESQEAQAKRIAARNPASPQIARYLEGAALNRQKAER